MTLETNPRKEIAAALERGRILLQAKADLQSLYPGSPTGAWHFPEENAALHCFGMGP
jgi:hypothetical protein